MKALGDRRLTRPRCSLKPALGSGFLSRLGWDSGVAGIVPTGTYTLPGVVWSKGERKGQFETFALRGANRRDFVAAWRAAWLHQYPGRDVPVNDWLFRVDSEALDPMFHEVKSQRRRERYVPQLRGKITVAEPYEAQVQVAERYITGDGWAVRLMVYDDGSARVLLDEFGRGWLVVGRSISDAR